MMNYTSDFRSFGKRTRNGKVGVPAECPVDMKRITNVFKFTIVYTVSAPSYPCFPIKLD